MNKKLWVNIIISFVAGSLATFAGTIVTVEDSCPSGAMTCYLNKGYPFPMLHGLGYEGLPWDVNWFLVLINALFWISISLVIFAVIIPFIRENLLKKKVS